MPFVCYVNREYHYNWIQFKINKGHWRSTHLCGVWSMHFPNNRRVGSTSPKLHYNRSVVNKNIDCSLVPNARTGSITPLPSWARTIQGGGRYICNYIWSPTWQTIGADVINSEHRQIRQHPFQMRNRAEFIMV